MEMDLITFSGLYNNLVKKHCIDCVATVEHGRISNLPVLFVYGRNNAHLMSMDTTGRLAVLPIVQEHKDYQLACECLQSMLGRIR